MHLFASTRHRNIMVILTVLTLMGIVSCRTEYTTRHFSFPPGSKPHENDWEYTALVILSSSERPITKKSKKNVQIKIYDKTKSTLLSDNIEFTSASIETNVVWNKFEKITIELIEVGNKYAKDSYNAQLLKSGPNSLLRLVYQYNRADKKFKRVD